MLAATTLVLSTGSTDMTFEYRNQTTARMRNANPKLSSEYAMATRLPGSCLSWDTAPIERAKPNIISERV
jgi:hypothetical protein